jgi:hypothetical protein
MNRTIKYGAKVLALCSTLVLASAYAAAAPRFTGKAQASFTATDADGEVSISFKENGLDPNTTVTYLAGSTVTASYACFNVTGTSCIQRESITDVSNTPGGFTSNSRGIASGALSLAPTASTLVCSTTPTPTLLSVSYSNINLQDVSNGVTAKVSPTSLSATYADCP